MLSLTPFTSAHFDLLTTWLDHDPVGQETMSSYKVPQTWLNLINNTTRWGWLIVDEDTPIGFIDLEKFDNDQGSFGIYIAPQYRKRGFGKNTLSVLFNTAKQLGIDYLLGTAEETNIPSQKLLLSAGFVQRGRDKDNFLQFVRDL